MRRPVHDHIGASWTRVQTALLSRFAARSSVEWCDSDQVAKPSLHVLVDSVAVERLASGCQIEELSRSGLHAGRRQRR